MLSSSLKAFTLSSHQQLEKVLISKMRGIRSNQNYIALLQLFYTFFGGLEQRIDCYVNPQNLPDYAKRRKTGLLSADIIALAGRTHTLAGVESLPVISSYLQALGALYVIEGSTLGGKIISKMISQQLNITDGAGLSFFLGYGDDTEEMWVNFKKTLDATTDQSDQEKVMMSANNTFIKFSEWIAKHPND